MNKDEMMDNAECCTSKTMKMDETMENAKRWYFTKKQLDNTPSISQGFNCAQEQSHRRQAADLIQDMGNRLDLTRRCINTAIVCMHRFYVYVSFTEINKCSLAIAALYFAAKVEEQPRKLEDVIRVAHDLLHKGEPLSDVRMKAYVEEILAHENFLVEIIGCVSPMEHPHTYIVKACELVKATKELYHASYIIATTSLHLTTMSLQYKPTVVACICIYLGCKWSRFKMKPCSEGRAWFYYVDKRITLELIESLTKEYSVVLATNFDKFERKFGKDSVVYRNPKSMIESAASQGPSTSENRSGLSRKVSCTPDFDKKRALKYNGLSHPSKEKDHGARKLSKIVKNNSSKKVPEVYVEQEPHFKPRVPVKPEVHIKLELHSKHADVEKRHANRESSKRLPLLQLPICKVPSPIPSPLQSKAVDNTHSIIVENNVGCKRSLEHSEHERKKKHKSKHSSHSSSKENHSSKYSFQVGLKVSIPLEKISLKKHCESQRNSVPIKAESPQKRISRIKQPSMPATPKVKEPILGPIKMVFALHKYGASIKHECESGKRSHSNVA